MIDKKLMDEILPVPDLEELKEEKIQELKEEGFVITNYSTGGIFNTLIMIVLQIRIELVQLLRNILNNMFITHAEGIWLELKAADFSKKKKQALKVKGNITLSRLTEGEAVKIPKATIFKTQKDINGDELRFFTLTDAILQKKEMNIKIPIEAEKAGTQYNVPAGQISRSLMHIEGIDSIKNEEDWIQIEGSDMEDDESLRTRTLNSWSELSMRPTSDKYKNICEAVEGVLYVRVDDQHPRGQGTIDIIVTSPTGAATEALLNKVKEAAEKIRGEYDNLLVKSSETVQQNIAITIVIPVDITDTDIEKKAISALMDLFKVNRERKLNELILIDIICTLKNKIPVIKNIKFNTPTEDVIFENDKVIILGEMTIAVTRE